MFHGQPCAIGFTDKGTYQWTVRSHLGTQVWGTASDLRSAIEAAERAVDRGLEFEMSARRRALARAKTARYRIESKD